MNTAKLIYYQFEDKQKNEYPVIIVVSPKIEAAQYVNNYGQSDTLLPSKLSFCHLNTNSKLIYYVFDNLFYEIEKKEEVNNIIPQYKIEYQSEDGEKIGLQDNNEPGIILKTVNSYDELIPIKQADKIDKLLLSSAFYKWLILDNERLRKYWYELYSINESENILSPLSGFIVVENQDQWQELKNMKEEILSPYKDTSNGSNISSVGGTGSGELSYLKRRYKIFYPPYLIFIIKKIVTYGDSKIHISYYIPYILLGVLLVIFSIFTVIKSLIHEKNLKKSNNKP